MPRAVPHCGKLSAHPQHESPVETPHSLQVKVKPNAREDSLTLGEDGIWQAHIKAAPVDGKANDALIALVARYFKLHKQQIRIKSGSNGRIKRLLIAP